MKIDQTNDVFKIKTVIIMIWQSNQQPKLFKSDFIDSNINKHGALAAVKLPQRVRAELAAKRFGAFVARKMKSVEC